METQAIKADKFPYPLMGIAGIATILFCVACIAAILGRLPTSMVHGLGIIGGAVVGVLIGNYVGGRHGNHIAMIKGTDVDAIADYQNEKSANLTKSYDITVRLEDGSSRIIHEENPLAWRSGIRVKVITG